MNEENAPAVGDFVKVHLPGETPWAECVAVHADGTWDGRIDNHLVCTEEHGLRVHDVVRFVPYADAPRCPWTPLRCLPVG